MAVQASLALKMEVVFQPFTQFALFLLCPKLYNFFPTIVKFLPGSHQNIFRNWKLMKNFVLEKIEKHKEDWNPSESRDFIDSYLEEMTKVSKQSKPFCSGD